MRVVGGFMGGRRYEISARLPACPTTDRAKEGLFNILSNLTSIEELRVLDLFAGSGGMSYEFVSRGAGSVTSVEKDRHSITFIRKTAQEFGILEKLEIVATDVFKFLRETPETFDLIFADPPYALPQMASIPEMILSGNLLADDGLFILEHATRQDFSLHSACFRRAVYGDSTFSFFRKTQPPLSPQT